MMKKTSPVLRFGLAAAVVALFPLTEAAAHGQGASLIPPIAAGSSPGRLCTFTPYTGKTVQIIAGPANATAGDNTQANNFPVKVSSSNDSNCPSSVGQCLKWEYKWIYTGVSPSYSFVTLDSDLALFEAAGGVTPTRPYIGNPPLSTPSDVGEDVAEVRVLRFNAYNNNTGGNFNGAVYTGLEARVGKVTAGFRSGDKDGFCAIQGAENAPGGDFLQSKSTTVTTTTLGCKVDWTLSADGCVTGAALNPTSQANPPQSCSIATQTISGQSGAVIGATCGAEISVPGSTTTCRWSSTLRTNVCVTVP